MKTKEAQDAQIIFLDAPLRLADEAHAARGDVVKAADIIVHACHPPRQNSALMVKSRRSASFFQSRPNTTRALRPKVSTSSRNVVTSNGRPSTIAVTVPCSMPVGTAFPPAAATRRITSSGKAVVAISISPTGRLHQCVAHGAADHAGFFAVAD